MRMLVLLSLLAAGPLAAAPVTDPVEWTIGETQFRGVLVYDDASDAKRPGLLMAPNWMGVTDAAVAHAAGIAGSDYVVLVADLYGADVRPDGPKAAAAATTPLREDRALMRARANKALEVLRAQAGRAPLDLARLAAIGFCFGGTVVLELARDGADLAGVVSFHGGLSTDRPAIAGAVDAGVLVLNGADDRGVAAEDIAAFQQEMTAAGADWTFVNFGGAVHCFSEPSANRPPNCVYHARSAKRAFGMMRDYLDGWFAAG
jgi:dienelactone hydrolase